MKASLPIIVSNFELTPEGFNTLISGHTQQLDELNILQRRLLMGFAHIERHQVVQSLNNLS